MMCIGIFNQCTHSAAVLTPVATCSPADKGLGKIIFTSFPQSSQQMTQNTVAKGCFLFTGVPQGLVLSPIFFVFYTRSFGLFICMGDFCHSYHANDT